MLFYLSLYALAAVLLFQGVHALSEQSAPTGVVPPEVRTNPGQAGFWGGFLVVYATVMILTGLASHADDWFEPALAPLRGIGFAVLACYGLWLVFGRKVDYTPAPVAVGGGHDHH
jgi:hypothetical protein